VTITFNNNSKVASLESRILNSLGKVTYGPSQTITFKAKTPEAMLFEIFDAFKLVLVGTVVTLKDQGTLKSNPLVHRAGTALSSSVAVAGSSALLPPLSKWEKTSVGYELDINGASFSVWKSGNSGKFRVAASRIHKAFPKLAKQFPHSYVALCRGELLNERTPDADVFKTPTEALKAFTAKLKLALIRNTNADATATAAAKAPSKFDAGKTYSYYYRTVRLGFEDDQPQNRVDIWLCAHMDFDYSIAKKFKARNTELRAESKRGGGFGNGIGFGEQGRDIKLSSIKGSFRHSHTGINGKGPLFVLHDAKELKGAKLREILSSTVESVTRAGSATASYVAVAESDELSDRVASIVYGDLKRIKSTIAAWKGKMTPEQYEEFEAYQNSVAKFIATTYVKRMSKAYQAKTNSI
jgi:hypothetical protein